MSYGDGFGNVWEHAERVDSLGMKALGLTEHGNLSSAVQLEQECKKRGLKPIYGCEIYLAPPNEKRKWHQTVLAMDEEGLRSLNRLVSQSYLTLGTTSKSKFPTVHWDVLEANSRGLIVLSGCADSLLSCTLLGGKSLGEQRETFSRRHYENSRRVIERYQKVFGDRYYLEVQRFPGLPRTCVLNPAFAQLSQDTGALLAATADVHYCLPTDNTMQKILHAANRGSTVAKTEAGWEYSILLTYPQSDKEIIEDVRDTGLTISQAKAAVLETELIAGRCEVELPKSRRIKYPIAASDWEPW